MNKNHFQHFESENKAGRINLLEYLDGKWQLTEATNMGESQQNTPASELIAQAIYTKLKPKNEGDK